MKISKKYIQTNRKSKKVKDYKDILREYSSLKISLKITSLCESLTLCSQGYSDTVNIVPTKFAQTCTNIVFLQCIFKSRKRLGIFHIIRNHFSQILLRFIGPGKVILSKLFYLSLSRITLVLAKSLQLLKRFQFKLTLDFLMDFVNNMILPCVFQRQF